MPLHGDRQCRALILKVCGENLGQHLEVTGITFFRKLHEQILCSPREGSRHRQMGPSPLWLLRKRTSVRLSTLCTICGADYLRIHRYRMEGDWYSQKGAGGGSGEGKFSMESSTAWHLLDIRWWPKKLRSMEGFEDWSEEYSIVLVVVFRGGTGQCISLLFYFSTLSVKRDLDLAASRFATL